jgi:phage tail P2-like protein
VVLDKTQAAYCTETSVVIGARMSNSLMATGSSVLEQRAAARAPSSAIYLSRCVTCGIRGNARKFLPYLAWAFSVDRWDENWRRGKTSRCQ